MTYHIDFGISSCGVYFDHDEETGATKRHNADGSITAGRIPTAKLHDFMAIAAQLGIKITRL